MAGELTTTMELSHLIRVGRKGTSHLTLIASLAHAPALCTTTDRSSRETGNKCPSLLCLCCQPRGGG